MRMLRLLPAALFTLCLVGSASAQVGPSKLPEEFLPLDDRACGTTDLSQVEMDAVQAQLQSYIKSMGRGLEMLAVGGQIKVAWHVIYNGSTGNIPQSQIDASIAELNKAYSGFYGGVNTGYTFVLASVDRTNNRQWFGVTPQTNRETQMKNALAIDPAHRLNVYSAKPGQNLLGWAYFPNSFPENNKMHGVVIHYGSVPGGYLAPFNLGGTLDHEVGHYLGLYHTFQGGCSGNGDFVADTPPEATPTSGCPLNKDTCAGGGLDPIHNYMDYSNDACYTQFTAGQDARMDVMVPTYRPSLLNAAVAERGGFLQNDRAAVSTSGTLSMRVGPNPFAGETNFAITLPSAGDVSLEVFSVTGQRVATVVESAFPAGEHNVAFRPGRLPAGMYFAVLRANGEVARKRIVLAP
jgi:Pregnancy-associated plasma protein-A